MIQTNTPFKYVDYLALSLKFITVDDVSLEMNNFDKSFIELFRLLRNEVALCAIQLNMTLQMGSFN